MRVIRKWQIWPPPPFYSPEKSYKKDIVLLVRHLVDKCNNSPKKCNRILLLLKVWHSINSHPSIRTNSKYQLFLIYVLSRYIFKLIPQNNIRIL